MLSHKSRQLYGSVLLVLLVILYYYYTRIHDGFVTATKPKIATTTVKPTTTTATTVKPTTATATTVKPTTTTTATTVKPTTTATTIRTPAQIAVSKKVEEIKDSYFVFYGLMSDLDKYKMRKIYNHYIENVIKDDFPPFIR